MSLRVVVSGEVKHTRSRSESESEQGAKLVAVDPKLSDLSMGRLKLV